MENEGGNMVNDLLRERRVKGAVLLLLLVLSTFFLMKTIVEAKSYRFIGSGTTATNVISVSGTGEVFAVPDIAEFSFSVTEEHLSVATAQEAATKKMNAILDAIKKAGVDEKDIKTVGYNIYPRYEWETKAQICPAGAYCPPTNGERVLKGYEVSQSVSVKVRDTAKAGELLSNVGSLGAQNVSGLTFTFDDMDKVQADARADAIEEARAKAKELAKSLGVRLVRVVNFQEGFGGPAYYKGIEMMAVDGRGDVAMSAPAPEVPAGENKVTSTVTITYEIR